MRLLAAICVILGLSVAVVSPSGAAPAPKVPEMGKLFGGSFELVDQDGKTFTDKDLLGSYSLIYFGYTYCPDICPTSLSLVATALDELGEKANKIQPVFITIDPGRDRPEHLKDYVSAFHPRMIGLSGTEAQVKQVAKAYRVHRTKVLEKDKPVDEYLVNHSSITYLMGPDGNFLTMFPHGTDPAFMVKAMEKYLTK